MKILQILQRSQLRGAEIFACQLSQELIKLGHEVHVLFLFGDNNSKLSFELDFIELGASESKRFLDFGSYRRLNQIIRSGKYDIVQANAGDTLKYAAVSKLFFKWKTPLIFRNANLMSSFIKSTWHKRLNGFFLRQADFAISVSEKCRQDLIDLYPKFNNSSETGTIGTYSFDSIVPVESGTKGKIWINVGSFVVEKNHEFLLEIFQAYLQHNPETELWLVGDGKLRPQLESKVERLNINGKVKFLGYRNDVVSLIKRASIMVITSKIEGLPGVILEALSCGTPVVASSAGGIPEVVVNGETGYSIEGFNKQEYINAIQNILTNRDKYDEIVKNGKLIIKEKFLMTKIAADFEKIYLHVLNAENKSTSHH